jgi:hypothetical protein
VVVVGEDFKVIGNSHGRCVLYQSTKRIKFLGKLYLGEHKKFA